MADQWNARPVSGEIMTAAPAAATGARVGADLVHDFVDAEFETVAPEIRTDGRTSAGAGTVLVADIAPIPGMDMLRCAEVDPGTVGSRHGGPFFWLAGVAIAAAAFWVSGGHALVLRPAISTAEPSVATALLRIHDVRSRVERSGDRVMLFVDGEAVNDGHAAAELPPIQIRVATPDGHVTRYNLGTAERSIAAGGRFSFSSRVEVHRNGVKSVSVEFKENGDAGGTGQGY